MQVEDSSSALGDRADPRLRVPSIVTQGRFEEPDCVALGPPVIAAEEVPEAERVAVRFASSRRERSPTIPTENEARESIRP
jgi:hypothetical protein